MATHVYELRVYHPVPGRAGALEARFRDHTIGLFAKHGMEVVGFWRSQEGGALEDAGEALVYVLAFPDRETAERCWREFRADPVWQDVVRQSEANGPIVGRIDSTFMEALDFSPIR